MNNDSTSDYPLSSSSSSSNKIENQKKSYHPKKTRSKRKNHDKPKIVININTIIHKKPCKCNNSPSDLLRGSSVSESVCSGCIYESTTTEAHEYPDCNKNQKKSSRKKNQSHNGESALFNKQGNVTNENLCNEIIDLLNTNTADMSNISTSIDVGVLKCNPRYSGISVGRLLKKRIKKNERKLRQSLENSAIKDPSKVDSFSPVYNRIIKIKKTIHDVQKHEDDPKQKDEVLPRNILNMINYDTRGQNAFIINTSNLKASPQENKSFPRESIDTVDGVFRQHKVDTSKKFDKFSANTNLQSTPQKSTFGWHFESPNKHSLVDRPLEITEEIYHEISPTKRFNLLQNVPEECCRNIDTTNCCQQSKAQPMLRASNVKDQKRPYGANIGWSLDLLNKNTSVMPSKDESQNEINDISKDCVKSLSDTTEMCCKLHGQKTWDKINKNIWRKPSFSKINKLIGWDKIKTSVVNVKRTLSKNAADFDTSNIENDDPRLAETFEAPRSTHINDFTTPVRDNTPVREKLILNKSSNPNYSIDQTAVINNESIYQKPRKNFLEKLKKSPHKIFKNSYKNSNKLIENNEVVCQEEEKNDQQDEKSIISVSEFLNKIKKTVEGSSYENITEGDGIDEIDFPNSDIFQKLQSQTAISSPKINDERVVYAQVIKTKDRKIANAENSSNLNNLKKSQSLTDFNEISIDKRDIPPQKPPRKFKYKQSGRKSAPENLLKLNHNVQKLKKSVSVNQLLSKKYGPKCIVPITRSWDQISSNNSLSNKNFKTLCLLHERDKMSKINPGAIIGDVCCENMFYMNTPVQSAQINETKTIKKHDNERYLDERNKTLSLPNIRIYNNISNETQQKIPDLVVKTENMRNSEDVDIIRKISDIQETKCQILNVLQICHTNARNVGIFTELLEAERLLLLCDIKERQLRKLSNFSRTSQKFSNGRCIRINSIKIPLKMNDDGIYYEIDDNCWNFYVCVLSYKNVTVSTFVKQQEGLSVTFDNVNINFNNLDIDFIIQIELFNFQLERYGKNGFFVKEMPQRGSLDLTGIQSLDNSNNILTFQNNVNCDYNGSHFKLYGAIDLDLTMLRNIPGTDWTLTDLNYEGLIKHEKLFQMTEVHGDIAGQILLDIESKVTARRSTEEISGFLTITVLDGKNWNRYWCKFDGYDLMCWKYPQDQFFMEPAIKIDLRKCIDDQIDIADKTICNRARTFQLQIVTDRDRKIYFFSTDNQIELQFWLSHLKKLHEFLQVGKSS